MKSTASDNVKEKDAAAEMDVIQLLHADHQRVRELFFQFSQADKDKEKAQLVQQILKELYMHATLEEEIVYPALREEGDDVEDMMDEADTEHHVVKLLMAELVEMKPGDDHFDSKVTVLCELVDHHVKGREKEMFEKMSESDIDLEELGEAVLKRKSVLEKSEVPQMKHPISTTSRGRARKKKAS